MPDTQELRVRGGALALMHQSAMNARRGGRGDGRERDNPDADGTDAERPRKYRCVS
jgi:hypothetical protein